MHAMHHHYVAQDDKIINNEEHSSNRERYRSLLMRLDDYKYDEIMSRLIISFIQLECV